MLRLFLIFSVAFLISVSITPLITIFALKTGYTAIPKQDRWHKKETALLGGIPIFLSVILAWALSCVLFGWGKYTSSLLALVVCSSLMFVLGLVDDTKNISPPHKLLWQIAITSILIFFGINLEWTASAPLNVVLSFLWIVGITNAFNLLDNMDGLAAGIAFIATIFLIAYFFININHGYDSHIVIASAFAGAILGFLLYNFNPASIFMGDAGSLFIGFTLAGLTTFVGNYDGIIKSHLNILSVIAIPIMLMFIPILDTSFVSVMRILFHRPISLGGRDHSSHRMVLIGFSERKSVLVLYGFAIMSGFVALALNYLKLWIGLPLITGYVLFVVFFWFHLGRIKVYDEKSIFEHDGSGWFTPLLAEITYKRRIFEVVLDFVLISLSYYMSYLLRFEWNLFKTQQTLFLKSLPVVIGCYIICFFFFGIYKGVWRTVGLKDLLTYVKAVTAGTGAVIFALLLLYRFESFSRSLFFINWGLLLSGVCITRVSFRLLSESLNSGKKMKGKRTLIYGAGSGGIMAFWELTKNDNLDLNIVGFMDDDPSLRRRKIRGYDVFGNFNDLEKILISKKIEVIVISFNEGSGQMKDKIKELCDRLGADIEIKVLKITFD